MLGAFLDDIIQVRRIGILSGRNELGFSNNSSSCGGVVAQNQEHKNPCRYGYRFFHFQKGCVFSLDDFKQGIIPSKSKESGPIYRVSEGKIGIKTEADFAAKFTERDSGKTCKCLMQVPMNQRLKILAQNA